MIIDYESLDKQNIIKGPILTIGTFDSFHVGHFNLLNKMKFIFGEEFMVIAVASDEWSLAKGKKTINNQECRVNKIKALFPKAKVTIEDSKSSFGDVERICKEFNVKYIFGGADQRQAAERIKKTLSDDLKDINFIYLKERTQNISTSKIKEALSNKNPSELKLTDAQSDEIKMIAKKSSDTKSILNNWNDSSDVIQHNDLVIKIHNDNKSLSKKECKFHLEMNGNSILLNNNTFVYKYLDGTTLSKIDIDKNIISLVSEEIIKLRTLYDENLNFKKSSDYLISFEKTSQFIDINEQEQKIVSDACDRLKIRNLTTSHADLNHRNILLNKGSVNFIDFENVRYTFDTYDFGSFVSHSKMNSSLREDIFKINNINHKVMIDTMIICLFNNAYWNMKLGIEQNRTEKINYSIEQTRRLKWVIENNNLDW